MKSALGREDCVIRVVRISELLKMFRYTLHELLLGLTMVDEREDGSRLVGDASGEGG